MTEFRRLIEECDSQLGQAVLRAGRHHTSDARRGQVLAALGVGAAVTATAKTSFALSALWQSALWKKVFVGGVVAGGGFAGASIYHASTLPADSPEPTLWSTMVAVDDAIEVRPIQHASETPVAEVSRPAIVDEPPEPVGRASRARTRDQASAAGLNEELELLDQARAAVRRGRPNEALARLDEHSARFPKGSLSLEAQVLRVQGLAAAGRTEEASRRAKRILSRSPNSVVAQRLRQYVIE